MINTIDICCFRLCHIFPLIKSEIQQVLGESVALMVDSGKAIAKTVPRFVGFRRWSEEGE
ncbi:hypothetical protein OK016_08270 [Vibrio chagasii]|nr:hypothetical protein [Vibrio chagasii]